MNEPEQDDFHDILNKLYEGFNSETVQQKGLNDNNPEKLIECQHEIIFKITANVLQQNDDGELTSSKEICHKNYHIPVPSGSPYKEYMDSFFTFLENCLLESADKSYNTGPTNEEETKK